MKFRDELKQLLEIYDSLYDEESRKIFEARYKYAMGCISWSQMCDAIFPYIKKKEWHDLGLVDYFNSFEEAKKAEYVIFGAGERGHVSYQLLNELGFKVVAFSDNDKTKHGKKFDGLQVLSPIELAKKYRNCYIIVAVLNLEAQANVFRQLLLYNIKPTRILLLRAGAVWGFCGTTYFDFPTFRPSENEVFIDCGCYDGETIFSFLKWCNGKYKKIYGFEPDLNNYEVCINKLKDVKEIQIFQNGLWNRDTKLSFCSDANDSSKISKNGPEIVEVRTIDSALSGEAATFIKMDIEGSELEALEGAAYTIKNYRPKLAISVYHKRQDLYNIVLYLKELIHDYNFSLRTYTLIAGDTVLYAW